MYLAWRQRTTIKKIYNIDCVMNDNGENNK